MNDLKKDLVFFVDLVRAFLEEETITTKSGSGYGCARIQAYVKSGSSAAALGTDGNILSVEAGTNVKFIFDSEGEMHSDAIIGVGEDWDEWSDLQMASDLSRLPKAKFNEMMKYKAEDFEKAGLLTLSTDEEGNKHAFVKHKAMLMFAMCCFGETYNRISVLEKKIKIRTDSRNKINDLNKILSSEFSLISRAESIKEKFAVLVKLFSHHYEINKLLSKADLTTKETNSISKTGKELVKANDSELIKKIVEIKQNKTKANSLSLYARRAIKNRYNWDKILFKYGKLV